MSDDQGETRRERPADPRGETFGEAGGYNTGPGQSSGAFEGGDAGGAHGQQDGGYTGQTGTGYGRTPGGEAGQGRSGGGRGRPEGPAAAAAQLWGRAREAVSGVMGDLDGRTPGGQQGLHRGRGPKNYSRSDHRIQEDVNDRLTDDHFLDATHIDVNVAGGEVTLGGTVTSRADKRRAEDLADEVSGVKHVQNNLRIQEAGPG
jgi:osmotically-inducible protein OsmY